MFARQLAEISGGWPGDRLGGFDVGEAVSGLRDGFRQHDQVGFLLRRFPDEWRELPEGIVEQVIDY